MALQHIRKKVYDIKQQATRRKRASSLKRHIETDLEMIEDMANKVMFEIDELLEETMLEQREANCAIFDVSQRSELLAFKRFISKTPQAELEYYSDEEFTDLYIKANCS